MSQVTRAASKLKFETGDRPTQSDFTDLHDSVLWYDEQTDNSINAFTLLGSGAKGFPIGYTIANISSNQTLTENTLYLVACELRKSYTITGVKWYQSTQGNYTADQYNGVGLYTISGGVLTLVASSTDDGNIWKAAANGMGSKAFSGQYVATAGVYYIGLLYNNSSQVTAPQIGSVGAVGSVFYTAADFSNSYKLHATLAAQNSLPSSVTMSATTGLAFKIFPFLY